ncbi:phosphate butyryltransferase [Rhodovulum bhavnagarense]|uniref:Phosphate butyryltransferase n=1 Tax=Rhodovulum bhavnagarense TaxID=992286 RepID=A0A4R2RK15_9RHOB|nr:bifunctional enoyl-CoA hydratase/phosphate acetyltransferase [Rhodovulum bhavnagarense]TCP63128.1 phosphate butyryltransferase [Rhodovulum bhavnagarense]
MKIEENRTFEEISVGDAAQVVRVCTEDDFYIFATASGNHNPMHLARHDGDGDGAEEAIAPALWVGSLVSAAIGNVLPGAGALYRAQSFVFHERAHAGDELVARVTVTEKHPPDGLVMATDVTRKSDGAVILSGEARVQTPARKMVFEDLEIPGLLIERHRHFDALIARAEPLPPLPTAVIAPEEPKSLGGALLGARHTIITPILVGNAALITAVAAEIGESLDGVEVIDAPDHARAANIAVDLVCEGRAQAVMKGHLHTDVMLKAVLRKENGLRTGRRLTHVFVMDVPGVPHPLLVTDAAINIAPDLRTKMDICQNAIDLAISLGIELPKVGVLSAVETVNPDIPSSLDAALLSKMAERGQIFGGLVDGPLAMDNAVDLSAARTKGLTGQVAGRAEVLVVPNLDAGNMLAKQLAYISHAEGAGVVMGAKVPIILNSRSDDDKARLASCAVAALHEARISGRIAAPRAAE